MTSASPRTRWWATALLSAVVLVLAACGGADTGDTAGQTRTIDTPAGQVEVPVHPERVVATHNIGTQPLLDLGIVPVGIAKVPPSIVIPEYAKKLQDVPVVANGENINVEKILELKPDLILAHSNTDSGVLDQMRSVAPVVLVPIEGELRSDWQKRVGIIADAVNRPEQKKQLDADLARHAEGVATARADTLRTARVNFLDSFDDADFWAYGPESMVGKILTAAGAQFAPSATTMTATRGPGEAQLSREKLGDHVDGSLILYSSTMSDPVKPFGKVASVVDSPFVADSAAGRAGNVQPGGYGLVSNYGQANDILDRFDAALAQYRTP